MYESTNKEIQEMYADIDTKRKTEDRESGGSTHYYSFPACTETKDIIRYKKMNHPEGEIMCALMRLHDNGEYKRNLEKIIYYATEELKHYEK